MILNIFAKDAIRIMRSEIDYYILDVRQKEEYEAGHVDKAIHIPVDNLREVAQDILPDKNRSILVYCQSGNRAGKAACILDELGYMDIKNFGGYPDWLFEMEQE